MRIRILLGDWETNSHYTRASQPIACAAPSCAHTSEPDSLSSSLLKQETVNHVPFPCLHHLVFLRFKVCCILRYINFRRCLRNMRKRWNNSFILVAAPLTAPDWLGQSKRPSSVDSTSLRPPTTFTRAVSPTFLCFPPLVCLCLLLSVWHQVFKFTKTFLSSLIIGVVRPFLCPSNFSLRHLQHPSGPSGPTLNFLVLYGTSFLWLSRYSETSELWRSPSRVTRTMALTKQRVLLNGLSV